jgi:LmbE family N-acetylglucosaminyl deacetylase
MTLITPEHSGPGVSVMVVVAHPDDAEFMCSGTVAKWAKAGKEITYVLATSGDKGSPDPSIPPQDLALIREDEQRRVCQLLGVTNVEFLRYPDGTLQNSLELRKSIVRLIRKYKPTAVITENPTARWVGNYINHPDHRAIGDATMDAVFPSARDIHMFPELITEEGLGAHIVEHLYLGMMGDQANVFIDISNTIETKIAALRGHKSQMRDPTTNFDDGIRSMATRKDELGNESYLETFRYFYLGS